MKTKRVNKARQGDLYFDPAVTYYPDPEVALKAAVVVKDGVITRSDVTGNTHAVTEGTLFRLGEGEEAVFLVQPTKRGATITHSNDHAPVKLLPGQAYRVHFQMEEYEPGAPPRRVYD